MMPRLTGQTEQFDVYSLWLSIIWTALATVGLIYLWQDSEFAQQKLLFRTIMTVMPFAGLPFMWVSFRKLRRYRSAHCQEVSGKTEYVSTELDGSGKRSTTDPRPTWDKEDRNFAD